MRKIIHRYTVLLLTVLLVGTGIALADTDVIVLGDVNSDGSVNTDDVTALVNFLHGSGTVNTVVADVNRDGIIDIADVTAINNIISSGTFDKGTASTLFFPAATVDKSYGDAAFTNQLVRSGSTGAITYESSATGVATVHETTGEVTIQGVGTATITATLAASGGISGTTASYTVNVAQKEVTVSGITAENKGYDGTYTATLSYAGVTIAGKVDGDDLTVTATGTFESFRIGTGWKVYISDITLGGASAANYKLAASGNQTSTTADIIDATGETTLAPVAEVTDAPSAVSDGLTYNGSARTLFNEGSTSDGTLMYKVTASSTVPDNTEGFKTTIDQQTDAGTYYLWYYVVGDSQHNNSDINTTGISKTISKATLTATAVNADRSYGAANPSFTVNVTGFVNSESASTAEGYIAPTASTDATTESNVGTYDITPSGGFATNYDFTYKKGTLTIAKASGAATLSSSSVAFYNATEDQTVNVSNFTGTVSAEVTSGKGCSVSVSKKGKTITITRTSNLTFNATITVTIAASTNYNSATMTISVSGTAVHSPGSVVSVTMGSYKCAKFYTYENYGFYIMCTDYSGGVNWSTACGYSVEAGGVTFTCGTKSQWLEIMNGCGHDGWEYINYRCSGVTGWTAMSDWYWSSTESGSNTAWCFNLNDWEGTVRYKEGTGSKVRLIAFFKE